VLERLFGDIWQVYLLAGWCLGLTTAVALVVRHLYRREQKFPAVMMTAVLKDWDKHEDESREHVSQIEANTNDIGWMKKALRTHGELARRLDSVEGEVKGLKESVKQMDDSHRIDNRALVDQLREIGEGLAGVKGYAEGRANGRRTQRQT
jgi:hypothetical protein